MNPQIVNLGIMLFFMQASKKIPLDDPNVLNIVRAVYVLSNIIIFGIYYYIYTKIEKKKDRTTLEYVEPAPMGSQEDPKLVTTTNHQYDLSQVKQLFKGQMIGIGFMAVMHLYMKYTNPLMVQSIIPLKGAFESNLAKIYLFGKPASGDLKRPFKAGAGLMAGLAGPGGANEIKTDKASIEAARKSNRGGAREE